MKQSQVYVTYKGLQALLARAYEEISELKRELVKGSPGRVKSLEKRVAELEATRTRRARVHVNYILARYYWQNGKGFADMHEFMHAVRHCAFPEMSNTDFEVLEAHLFEFYPDATVPTGFVFDTPTQSDNGGAE